MPVAYTPGAEQRARRQTALDGKRHQRVAERHADPDRHASTSSTQRGAGGPARAMPATATSTSAARDGAVRADARREHGGRRGEEAHAQHRDRHEQSRDRVRDAEARAGCSAGAGRCRRAAAAATAEPSPIATSNPICPLRFTLPRVTARAWSGALARVLRDTPSALQIEGKDDPHGLLGPGSPVRLRRAGAAHRRADDAHPPRQAPQGLRRQRERRARRHLAREHAGRGDRREPLAGSRGQARRRAQQRRWPPQPQPLLGEHGPERRRRPVRRARLGDRRGVRHRSTTSRRSSRTPASSASAPAGRGSCGTARRSP